MVWSGFSFEAHNIPHDVVELVICSIVRSVVSRCTRHTFRSLRGVSRRDNQLHIVTVGHRNKSAAAAPLLKISENCYFHKSRLDTAII